MSTFEIRTPSGKPLASFVERNRFQPTTGLALYIGQRQRTRILDRTNRGVDVNGRRFTAYRDNGPYYHYPNGRVGNSKFAKEQNRAAAKRLYRKLARGGGDGIKLTSQGIKFENYAAFKRSLGRSGVDLRGANAPHMLQQIVVKAGSVTVRGGATAEGGNLPVKEFVIGIYGQKAVLANAHNDGESNMPQRKFFSASRADIREMLDELVEYHKRRRR